VSTVPTSTRRRRLQTNEHTAGLSRTLVALAGTAVFVVPIYMVLANVLKPGDEIIAHPLALPTHPTLDNFRITLGRPDHLFWDGLVNSLLVTALSVSTATILAAMLGHYLARSAGRASRLMISLLLAGMMIPGAVILEPIIEVLNHLGLMNTIAGLVVVNIGSMLPFGVLVFMGFVKTIPIELEQAAAVDGAGSFRTFWQIVFPLMRPAAASVMIFMAAAVWNDFITPLVVLGPSNGTTVTVGIYRSISEHVSDYGAVFAFMFLASVPVLIFFLAFQRHFVKGLMGGATKG
jgi:raffinose/stachyose/melibiose transport system permease protein